MTFLKLGIAFVASTLLFAAVPASAASPITIAFLANVDANVAFLDHSSRLATAHATSAPIRAFASSEAVEQAKVAIALDALVPAGHTDAIASAAPLDDIATGRSVAIDGSPAPVTSQAANGRAPIGEAALLRLTGLSGRAFDDYYWQTQLDALSQLEADYRAYIGTGDDPALVTMAKRELPRVMGRLEALSKI